MFLRKTFLTGFFGGTAAFDLPLRVPDMTGVFGASAASSASGTCSVIRPTLEAISFTPFTSNSWLSLAMFIDTNCSA